MGAIFLVQSCYRGGMSRFEFQPSLECEIIRLRRYFEDSLGSGGALVAIDPAIGRIIGSSRFYDLDPEMRHVVIGYTFLAREYWGKAHNREMKRLMLDHAFKFVPEIRFHVDAENVRSQKAVGKIGGRLTSEMRKPRSSGGSRKVFVYSIFRPAFRAVPGTNPPSRS